MSDFPIDSNSPNSSQFSRHPRELRIEAETRLKAGNAPTSLGSGLSADALMVLYKLASSADGAADGLKLLHELQTHQIELDLQHEQARANEQETLAELARYKALYEFAPVGYFIISREGCVLESNRAGAELLGASCNDFSGSLLENYLAPASREVISWKLKKLFNGTAGESCTFNTINGGKVPALRMVATLAPDREVVLMTISDMNVSEMNVPDLIVSEPAGPA